MHALNAATPFLLHSLHYNCNGFFWSNIIIIINAILNKVVRLFCLIHIQFIERLSFAALGQVLRCDCHSYLCVHAQFNCSWILAAVFEGCLFLFPFGPSLFAVSFIMDRVNSPEDLAEYLRSELSIPDRFCQAFIGTVTIVMLQLCQFLSL